MTASTVNTMYSLFNTQLSQFPRAVNVAQSYQHYKIKNIILRVKGSFDTYMNTGNAYQKPYFYYMIDKSGSIPQNVTLEGLKQMGAKPRALDEKALTVSWSPSVLEFTATQVTTQVGLPNKYKISPWLSTADRVATNTWVPSSVDHLGIFWGAFAGLTGVADPITYDVEVEVQFQFKKPITIVAPGAQTAIPAVFATPNDSVDGVVGGPDGDVLLTPQPIPTPYGG